MALAAIDGELHLAPDHQLGQVVLVGLCREPLPTTLPRRMTVIRSAISSTSYSLWLMKMMLWPSRAAAGAGRRRSPSSPGASAPPSARRGPGSARSRYSALRISTRCCQPTDRRPTLARRGRSRSRSGRPARWMRRVRCRAVEEDALRHRLLAEQDVLRHGQHRHQHEVLVDHADAPADRVVTGRDLDGLAVEQDLALVGRGQPVEDVHQGATCRRRSRRAGRGSRRARTSRSMWSLATTPGVALGDAAHLERWRLGPARRRRWFSPHICQSRAT